MRQRSPFVPTLLILAAMAILAPTASAQTLEWWNGFAPTGFGGTVTSLAVLDGELVAVGSFLSNGVLSTPVVAVRSGGQWQGLPEHPLFTSAQEVAVFQGEIVTNGVTPSWIDGGPWKWNGSQWEIVGQGLAGGYLDLVQASALHDGKLIVAGDFRWSATETVNGIASWDGTAWSPLGDGIQGAVFDMISYDGDLYVVGDLGGSGTIQFDNLGRWDGVQWRAVTGTFQGSSVVESGLLGPGGTFTDVAGYALAVHDGQLAIGGDFAQVGSTPASNLVLYDTVAQQWSVPSGGTAGVVQALESFQGDLVAGGSDTHDFGGSTASLAAWDGSSWNELGSSPKGTILDLLSWRGHLHVAGDFAEAGELRCGGLIVWGGNQYSLLQNPAGDGVNGQVYDLDQYQGKLVASGDFSHGGNLQLNNIGLWDGVWHKLGSGSNGPIERTVVDGDDLYAVGDFTEMGGATTSYVARYDGTQWQGYGSSLPGPANSVALYGGDLYVGGSRYFDGSAWRDGYVYRWDGGGWTPLITDQTVTALASYDGMLYMGTFLYEPGSGRFYQLMSSVDGVNWQGVRQDGAQWGIEGDGHDIERLVDARGALFILGGFREIDGGFSTGVARWDGTTLAQFGPSGVETVPPHSGMDMGRHVRDIVFDGTDAILACDGSYNGFTVLRWDGIALQWQNVGLGTNSSARAIAVYDDDLLVGGVFSAAGGQPEPSATFPSLGTPASGLARYHDPSTVVTPAPAAAPASISLGNNVPNPFNPRTQLSFQVPAGGGHIRLRILDLRGRHVRTLVEGFHAQGSHTVLWDGRDHKGAWVVSGAYVSELVAGDERVTGKMTLVR